VGKLKTDSVRIFDTYEGQTLLIELGSAGITMRHFPMLDVKLPKMGTVIVNTFGDPLGYIYGFTTPDMPCIKILAPPNTFDKVPIDKCQRIIDYIESEFK